ncbi:aspartyl-tRNA(Asn)/glutamyl-tRNA(Gln) amidotransferase subunit A [Spinactinospora alkalitolerans]|uniref:Aspartyl-tRNA(Asn)/glutamyl-tRNA(Gln) amidotransferase subunit A n=1 Tax=Spinactinospora alkalitolerans TaxID=687207 RepID=A0A852TW00_9ACTN|nr:amidase [Spinactinospora alkalitolerans]NYE48108.1 aspartyl-tRNA(Asn)/glutamyl-tRNA(Gln) amidotransferase subunit A [Spinactinospora alkalitolerans]
MDTAAQGLTAQEICYLPVSDLLAHYRSGALAPSDVLEAQIARTEELNGAVGAVADRHYGQARAAAAESDARYAAGTQRPLEGITVALKEEHPVAGEPLRLGSTVLVPEIPSAGHPIVDRIQAAGAVVHLRTTTPELCCAGYTRSDLWGVTRSPWNTAYSSGGSSGGSGAALAAGMTTLATGSDIAGSIRIPAAFNGVVGYKAPYGRVPAPAPMNLDTYCHDGAMARTVQDCVLLHDAIAGQWSHDMVSVPGAAIGGIGDGDLAGLTVGVARTLGEHPVAADVARGLEQAAEALRVRGAETVDLGFDWSTGELTRAAFAHYGTVMAPMVRQLFGDRFAEAQSYTRDFVAVAERCLAEVGTYAAVLAETRVQEDFAEAFTRVDALICPSSMIPALEADNDYTDLSVDVDGTAVDLVHHLQIPLTIPFNMASRLPVFAVQSGIAATGVPTSVQVAAPAYAERLAARVAHAVETARPWYRDDAWTPQSIRPPR